jgi:hypothetical protein
MAARDKQQPRSRAPKLPKAKPTRPKLSKAKPGKTKPPVSGSQSPGATKPGSSKPGRSKPPQVEVVDPGGPRPPSKRPGGAVDKRPAKATLAQVVDEINAIYVRGALETALAVAGVVVDRLLGGDERRLARGAKDPALASLAEHEGLRVPAYTLWTALEVYVQVQLFSEELAWQLSLAHHRALLGVPDTRSKRLLAQRAVREDLSRRDVQDAVTNWRARHKLPPIGRPVEDPAIVASRRLATAALRLSQAVQEKRPTGNQRVDVLRKLELTEKRLNRVKKTLGIAD